MTRVWEVWPFVHILTFRWATSDVTKRLNLLSSDLESASAWLAWAGAVSQQSASHDEGGGMQKFPVNIYLWDTTIRLLSWQSSERILSKSLFFNINWSNSLKDRLANTQRRKFMSPNERASLWLKYSCFYCVCNEIHTASRLLLRCQDSAWFDWVLVAVVRSWC